MWITKLVIFSRGIRNISYDPTADLRTPDGPMPGAPVVFTGVFRHQNILRQIVWRNRETRTKVV